MKNRCDFARNYAFGSIFQAQQDLHTSATLQSQFFPFFLARIGRISNFKQKLGLKNCVIIQQFFQMLQHLLNFAKFQKIQLDNLVDYEKRCKTHIFLQKSVPLQPKTNEFCRNFAKNWRLPYGSTTLPARPHDVPERARGPARGPQGAGPGLGGQG